MDARRNASGAGPAMAAAAREDELTKFSTWSRGGLSLPPV